MSWKFWKKSESKHPSEAKVEKLSGVKDIPELVARHLVTKLGKDPDGVWKLKGVVRQRPEGKDSFDFRVFDLAEATSKNLKIKDFSSFDDHPELIPYQGWFDKKLGEVHIKGGE